MSCFTTYQVASKLFLSTLPFWKWSSYSPVAPFPGLNVVRCRVPEVAASHCPGLRQREESTAYWPDLIE